MTEELTLVFHVPEIDFDGISVEVAIAELERQLKDYRNRDNIGMRAALDILKVVQQRYIEACEGVDNKSEELL